MTDPLIEALTRRKPSEIIELVGDLDDAIVQSLLANLGGSGAGDLPGSPAAQAAELDSGYVLRDHLRYLSDRLALAVEDVKAGTNRRLVVSMPPRSGKSQLASVYLPVWLLRQNPKFKIGLISHDPTLATGWGRTIRQIVEQHGSELGLGIAPDAGAVSEWQTTERGGVTSRSAPGQSITGRGFSVMLLDDVVKDFASAHSEAQRNAIWDWWRANAETRLEPPSLVVAIGTRWHQDDFIGRLLSTEYDGDPADWEVISFPALAEENDVLGRSVGDPLLSPLIRDETADQALARWAEVKRSVGMYSWSALFQQRPAPTEGAIFDIASLRYWTTDPEKATDDGKVRYLDPTSLIGTFWLDSWDASFKGTDDSDYVVGQRWMRHGANRFLIAQKRGRWSFTRTVAEMKDWLGPADYGNHVHLRLMEDKANGPAIIDTLRDEIAGLKPINPRTSKDSRARAITPEIESGNVYLPLPSEQPWVADLISELRSFPSGSNDDQVDALTQALTELRERGNTTITVPGDRPITGWAGATARRTIDSARTGIRRSPGG
jgi:predicted phage terminase large subunit-like protein